MWSTTSQFRNFYYLWLINVFLISDYNSNEVGTSLFSRSWLDKAQLCVAVILSKHDLRYRNVELQISEKQIETAYFVSLKTPITVLHCEATVKTSNYGNLEYYIHPHLIDKNKILILHPLYGTNPAEMYTVLDDRYWKLNMYKFQ